MDFVMRLDEAFIFRAIEVEWTQTRTHTQVFIKMGKNGLFKDGGWKFVSELCKRTVITVHTYLNSICLLFTFETCPKSTGTAPWISMSWTRPNMNKQKTQPNMNKYEPNDAY